MDVTFDYTGQNVATASADGTAKLFSTVTHKCSVKLEGHSGEVSKVGVCMYVCMYEYNACILDYTKLGLLNGSCC